MMFANPTKYSSLPTAPHANALPQGVPHGPWNQLYRSAPGAQLPAVAYPGMRGAGLGMPVQIVGGGLGEAGTGKKIALIAVQALAAAGMGAAVGLAVHGRRPVLFPALAMGGVSLATSLMFWSATSE
jgi:hypothetical protein